MQKINYANRGKPLEDAIEIWIDRYNNHPSFLAFRLNVNKVVTKKGALKYTKKENFDYMVIDIGSKIKPFRVFGFDAKITSKKKFYPSAIKREKPHQIAALEKLQKEMNHSGGFLVWFKRCDPIMKNLRWIDDFSKPATIADGKKFDFVEFFGLSQGDWML